MKREESESFLEMPYDKRQLIVVVDDQVVEAKRAAKSSTGVESNKVDWTEIFKKSLLYSSVPAIALGIEVVKAVNAVRGEGVEVFPISRSESNMLQFPPGHPRDRVLYVGNPLAPKIYYPAAQFHRMMFEHKFSEALKLLMALGAVEIMVEHQSGWGTEFSTDLNLPIGKQASATAGGGAKRQRDLLFQISLDLEGTTVGSRWTSLVLSRANMATSCGRSKKIRP